MLPKSRRRAAALAVLALSVAAAGCSTSSATSTTTTTQALTPTTVHYVPHFVTVAGHKVLLPTENGHVPINSYSSFGQNVIITSKGFEPFKLYAASKTPIVFTNLTASAQTVHFYDFPSLKNSPSIAPGRSWSFSYNAAINLGYGNPSGTEVGHLYIGGCPPNCS
jgi:hypothetical protein